MNIVLLYRYFVNWTVPLIYILWATLIVLLFSPLIKKKSGNRVAQFVRWSTLLAVIVGIIPVSNWLFTIQLISPLQALGFIVSALLLVLVGVFRSYFFLLELRPNRDRTIKKRKDTEERIYRTIEYLEQGLTQLEIAENLGMDERTIRRYVRELRERGLWTS